MARSLFEYPSPSLVLSSPGEYPSTGHDTGTSSGFVIIIVFFIAIIFNFVVRLFLPAKYNQRLQRQARAVTLAQRKLGLHPDEISALPKLIYHASTNGSSENEPIVVLECAVCINELVEGEMIRVLPICNHFFHVKCIDRWLSSDPSCSMCRAHLDLEKVKSGTVSGVPPLPQLTLCTSADTA